MEGNKRKRAWSPPLLSRYYQKNIIYHKRQTVSRGERDRSYVKPRRDT